MALQDESPPTHTVHCADYKGNVVYRDAWAATYLELTTSLFDLSTLYSSDIDMPSVNSVPSSQPIALPIKSAAKSGLVKPISKAQSITGRKQASKKGKQVKEHSHRSTDPKAPTGVWATSVGHWISGIYVGKGRHYGPVRIHKEEAQADRVRMDEVKRLHPGDADCMRQLIKEMKLARDSPVNQRF